MEVITIQSEAFRELLQKLDAISQNLPPPTKIAQQTILSNAEFIKVMNISARTAQTWRDQGLISFSQIGSKIYYKLSNVETMIDEHSRKKFKK